MASADDVDTVDKTAPGDRPRSMTSRTQREAADYVADLAGELAEIARGSKLDLLAYLLDVARLEARTRAQELADKVRRN